MCRLFGLHAGTTAATATFWLLDAPDSLAAQSHRNPDGTGIGVFDVDGPPVIDKQPMAAWDDADFASAARQMTGTTFVAHVRHASTGSRSRANTHPFEQDDRLFAHNGVIAGLEELDSHLADLHATDLVHGDTDSERLFALVTAQTARHHGDVRAGITAALEWVVARLPVYSVNFVLTTRTDLWALRYPAANELWILDRVGSDEGATMDVRTDRIHARSADLGGRPSVVVASEPMTEDPRWRCLGSGELVHVHDDLTIDSQTLFSATPPHQLTLDELAPNAAMSQQTTP